MDSARRGDSAEVTQPVGGKARGFSLAFVALQDPAHDVDLSQACSGGNSPLLLTPGLTGSVLPHGRLL